MANKTYQGRIVQKHDSSTNWAKATNFIPLKGEIIVYDDLKKIKIGDGKTKVGDLTFINDNDTLATVAKTGSYSDLKNKPTIPPVGNGTLTIQKNGTSAGTFTANATTNKTINITVPTKVSELTDDVVEGKYLPLTGGTMTGNLKVGSASLETNGYVTGTWLRTTANTALSSAASKIAVINDGWVYSRTADQIKSDIKLDKVDNVKQYSASNPPPYPVKSINGKTGAVTISATDVSAIPSTLAGTVGDTLVKSANGETWETPIEATLVSLPTGILKSNGTTISQATRGSDYIASGNIVKQTLVASETTPTENYAINWVYG